MYCDAPWNSPALPIKGGTPQHKPPEQQQSSHSCNNRRLNDGKKGRTLESLNAKIKISIRDIKFLCLLQKTGFTMREFHVTTKTICTCFVQQLFHTSEGCFHEQKITNIGKLSNLVYTKSAASLGESPQLSGSSFCGQPPITHTHRAAQESGPAFLTI